MIFFFANLLNGISVILDGLITLMLILVFARVVLSWVNADPYNPIVRMITSSVDPLLNMIKSKLPMMNAGGLDFTPIIVMFGLILLRFALVQTLADFAMTMRMGALG